MSNGLPVRDGWGPLPDLYPVTKAHPDLPSAKFVYVTPDGVMAYREDGSSYLVPWEDRPEDRSLRRRAYLRLSACLDRLRAWFYS